MTAKIPDDDYKSFHERPHPAILVTVEDSVSREQGLAISRSMQEYLEAAEDTNDMRPLWLKFAAIETARVHFLQPSFAPTDRQFLGELIRRVPATCRLSLIPSFDFKVRQWPKRRTKAAAAGKPLAGHVPRSSGRIGTYPPPDASMLPLKFRFFACEEAMQEAYELGTMFDRWPFYGFDKDDLKSSSDKLVSGFSTRYPYLAEVDKLIGGKLTSVITALGDAPHQPAFELRRFWMSVARGGVRSWEGLADDLLDVIADGKGDPLRFHEEPEKTTTGTARLYSPDRKSVTKPSTFRTRYKMSSTPVLTPSHARGMVVED